MLWCTPTLQLCVPARPGRFAAQLRGRRARWRSRGLPNLCSPCWSTVLWGWYSLPAGACRARSPSPLVTGRSSQPRSSPIPRGCRNWKCLCSRRMVRRRYDELTMTKTSTSRKKSMRARNLAQLRPIGVIRSTLKSRSEAPKQGAEGAPDAGLEIKRFAVQALDGIKTGQDLIVLTWFHQARRDVLEVHPRSDPQRRLTGVFATRSPDRPNLIGLHRVTVRSIEKNRLRIGPIEAIDGTPVIDIKPALSCAPDS